MAKPLPLGAFSPAQVPFVGLSVLPVVGTGAATSNQAQRNFGQVSALDTPQLTQTFTLRNTGTTPIVLERLVPTCHCTTAAVEGASPSAPLPTLAPGQQIPIHVTLALAGHPPGVLIKSVLVFTKNDPAPAAVLQMVGEVRPSLSFTPALLDFGQVTAGQTRALTLTATLDRRLVTRDRLPALVTTNPDIQIAPAPNTTFNAKKPAEPSTDMEKGTLVRTYTLTLNKDAAMGTVRGSVFFVASAVPDSSTAPVALPNPSVGVAGQAKLAPSHTTHTYQPLPPGGAAAASAFASASVLLMGQVTGPVAAQPQALAFGTVVLGQPSTRQVMLTGMSDAVLRQLKVETASPWFTADLAATPLPTVPSLASEKASSSRVLVVALSPDAPAGTLQSELKVKLSSGQRLVIPVSAYVTATPMP